MRPVPHCKELLIPKPPEHVTLKKESSDSDGNKEDTNFEQSCSSEPHLLTNMLTDYCWTIKGEAPKAKYSRKSSFLTF